MHGNLWIEDDSESGLRQATSDEWSRLYETEEGNASRVVAKTTVGDSNVSTMFIGIAMPNFGPGSQNAPPLLYETMIFGGDNDDFQRRTRTRAEAARLHEEVVKRLTEGKPIEDL